MQTLSGRRLQKYNLLKYRMIIAILDYMATMKGFMLSRMWEHGSFLNLLYIKR